MVYLGVERVRKFGMISQIERHGGAAIRKTGAPMVGKRTPNRFPAISGRPGTPHCALADLANFSSAIPRSAHAELP